MKFFVTGATGFVGSELCRYLLSMGHEVTALGRRESFDLAASAHCTYVRADSMMPGDWQQMIGDVDVVVNLAGESILQRWSDSRRSRIWKSRVDTTRNLFAHLKKGQTLVSISATGYYGDCGSTMLDEKSPPGTGFLADLCQAWEDAALKTQAQGVRVVIGRLGVVLGEGGAMEKMLPVFKLGMGGRLGNGHQWMPWIHMNDLLRALVTLSKSAQMSGVFNLVAPNPVTNRAFTETLGNVLNRVTLAPVPQMMLSLVFGEASRVMLDSQRAEPRALLESGFVFQYIDLIDALTACVQLNQAAHPGTRM